ncbi:MAG: hypothetical protein Q9173_002151 [Seirophora scorigena]
MMQPLPLKHCIQLLRPVVPSETPFHTASYPLRNTKYVGMLQDLVQKEEPVETGGGNTIYREDNEGKLERVAFVPKSPINHGEIEEDPDQIADEGASEYCVEEEHEKTLDTEFDQRFAAYRDEVAASELMNKALPDEDQLADDEAVRIEDRTMEGLEEEFEQEGDEEDVAEFNDPLDAYSDTDIYRRHPLTAAGKWGTNPWTIQLPKDTFVDPISAIFSEASNKHLTEVAHRVFGGKALPNSTATPMPKMVGETLKQSPIALEAAQPQMGDMEANAYLAAIMPGAYASVFASLIEVRKRLGAQWLQDLLRKEGGSRVLDAGAGGAGVLAWRELLRNEWEMMHPDVSVQNQRVPFGKSVVVTGSTTLRQRASTLLDNTTFLPRLPDYNPSVDHPALEKGMGTPRKQYDVILAPYTLWTLREDHMRKTQIQNLWSLLNPDGGVLIVLEKGVPRGFELVAGAREVLLKYHIASPGDTKFENHIDSPLEGRYREKETGMIVAPCTNHGKCPMYLFPGKAVGRRDYCHFMQRYIRPPFLQRLLGQKHRNHEDIRFSFVAVQRGIDLRDTENIEQGQKAEDVAFDGYDKSEQSDNVAGSEINNKDGLHPDPINPLSFPRIILPPLKKRGHIIFDACTPAGKLERWTVPRSFGKRAYADARKARWGDLWALGAKTRIPRRLKIGGEKVGTGGRRRFENDVRDPGRIREVGGNLRLGKRVALLPKNIDFEYLYLVIPYCCRVGCMAEQAQLFWDQYLKTFVIEVPSRNRSPTAAAPKAATPDDFRAPATMTASFITNPNAPRGSFFNPIPHLAEPVTAAATPGPASQASVYSSMCPQPNAAPLGSFHNPIPHGAFKPLENGAFAPASAPSSPPAATGGAHATSVAFPPDRTWQPSAAEIDTLFSSARLTTLSPNRTAQHPGTTRPVAPTRIIFNRPQAPTPYGNGELSSARDVGPTASQPSSQCATNLRHQSSPRAVDFRRVRFKDEQARAQASQDAASRAAARARENEAEVLEFTDTNAAERLGVPYRGLPPGTTAGVPEFLNGLIGRRK